MDENQTEPTAADLAAQMESSYAENGGGDLGSEDYGDDGTYAEGVDRPDTETEDSPYVTREYFDSQFSTLMDRLANNQAQGAPNPGLTPTHPQDADPLLQAFTDPVTGEVDSYGLQVAQRIAPVIRQQVGQEMYGAVSPMLNTQAQTTILGGLSPEAAQILQQTISDPNAGIDPVALANNPLALRAMRGMAQFEAAEAARTVAPRSDRGYAPSRTRSAQDPGEQDDIMRAFGSMPGFDPKSIR